MLKVNPLATMLGQLTDLVSTKFDALMKSDPTLFAIIRQINDTDGQVWLVGGAILDWTFGQTPKDYDFLVDTDNDISKKLVNKEIVEVECAKNYMGGTKINTRWGNPSSDFWRVKDCNIFKNNDATHPSVFAYPYTVPLSTQAIMFSTLTKEIVDGGFLVSVTSGVVEPQSYAEQTYVSKKLKKLVNSYGFTISHNARQAFGVDRLGNPVATVLASELEAFKGRAGIDDERFWNKFNIAMEASMKTKLPFSDQVTTARAMAKFLAEQSLSPWDAKIQW